MPSAKFGIIPPFVHAQKTIKEIHSSAAIQLKDSQNQLLEIHVSLRLVDRTPFAEWLVTEMDTVAPACLGTLENLLFAEQSVSSTVIVQVIGRATKSKSATTHAPAFVELMHIAQLSTMLPCVHVTLDMKVRYRYIYILII